MKRKYAVLVSLILTGAMIFAGCSSSGNETTGSSSVTETTEITSALETELETEASTEADSSSKDSELAAIKISLYEAAEAVTVTEDAVTFTDDSGREALTIQKNPQKVAVLYGSFACLWTEAGGDVKVAIGGSGAQKLYMEQIGRDITQDEGVVTVATSSSAKNWDIESILAEQPDLIVCSTAMSGYSTISAPAEAAGIPVIAVTYSGVGDYLKWFKVFANINSKPELWDSVAAVTADEISEILYKVSKESGPRVLSILPMSSGIKANLDGSDMGAIINALNGINVASEKAEDASATRVDIDLETMYAMNPEMIFIQCIGSEEEARAAMAELVEGNPVWQGLEAVKNGQVYYMPKNLFHNRPNHLYNESYRMMGEFLYPDIAF